MAKRQIHYQSAEYYRIKFLRSIVIALIVILLSLFPLMMMTQRGGSIWITVVVGAILALYFSFNIRANYRIWKDVQKEESRTSLLKVLCLKACSKPSGLFMFGK